MNRYLFLLICSLLFVTACVEQEEQDQPPLTSKPSGSKSGFGSKALTYLSDTGYSVIAHANLPKNGNQSSVAAELFDSKNVTKVNGGNIFTVRSGAEKGILNSLKNSDRQYFGKVHVASASQKMDFGIEYLPLDARKHRYYPPELAYVSTPSKKYVGITFDAHFPSEVAMQAPSNGQRYFNGSDKLNIQWTGDVGKEQIEVARYMHCTKDYKVIYLGAPKNSLDFTIDQLLKNDTKDYSDSFLDVLVKIFFGFLINQNKDKTIDKCDVDLIVTGSTYTDLKSSGSPLLNGGVAIMSRSDSVRIYFRPIGEYKL